MAPVLMVCSDSTEAVRIARRERATDLGPARLLAGPDRAVLQPMGAPEGADAGHLALWRLRPGWSGGPGHMDGSGRGRGFAPTPNSKPPPLGGVWLGGRMSQFR